MKRIWLFLVLPAFLYSNAIQVGKAYFQTQNFSDDTYYPLTAAPTRVAATSSIQSPYRLRSWLGGALWGTGKIESDYYVPSGGSWVQQNFQQHPVWATPVILEYVQPPGQSGSDPNSRGINLLLPFPYLKPDAPYSTVCDQSDWDVAPLQILAVAFNNVILVPTNTAPANDTDPVPLPWNPVPDALMVDRMGDFDADLILQDPSNTGTYLKLTQAQGSPFTFCETAGSPFMVIRNFMVDKLSTTAAAAVPGVTDVSYALIRGNQNNPAIFDAGATLNPAGMQDNFTTWAIFWKTSTATFTNLTTNNTLAWSNSGSSPNYFVIAAIPTVSDYPTTGRTYAQAAGTSPRDADTYAQELGKYAFNFITDTQIAYTVTDMYQLTTTYTLTLSNPYADASMVDGTRSVLALMPHHYQPLVFDSSIAAQDVLDLNGSTDFAPTGATDLLYWIPSGNLKTILGTTFKTDYIFNNFVPSMPPPSWDDPISNPAKGFSSTIGQFLFDNIDNEYVSENTAKAFAPWQTAYYSLNKGLYDVGKTLSKNAKELNLLLQFLQENQDTGKTWVEQQYNNVPALPDRPGATLSGGLRTSVQGSATPPVLAGVQGAISNNFLEKPIKSKGAPWDLYHFAFYDSKAHAIEIYPVSGDPSGGVPFPSRVNNPPVHQGATEIWEAFGVAAMLNDHHYQYGYWIAAAALATLYDGAWNQSPTASGKWGRKENYGAAIDQLVMDVAYDPAIDDAYYKHPNMTFAKLNFFDQWAGHGWADGLQGTLAGGTGHNENSVLEALQCYSSVLLWGMATINNPDNPNNRKKIIDLGIYLYMTASYASDHYFYDKNLNLKPGNSFSPFVPVTTKAGDPDYPAGSSFWDFTIHTSDSSGTPKLQQSAINYSTDFGQTPANIKFITAFPVAPWTIVCGRNPDYLNAWNESWNTAAFQANIANAVTGCWQISYYGNMNMLAALGGNTQAYGTTDAIDPYQFTINLMTDNNPGVPPWGVNQQFNDPSQSIAEVLHLLHTVDHYGIPDWSIYAHATFPSTDVPLFTLACTKSGTTTYFAFNPTLEDVKVQFFRIGTGASLTPEISVPPKRWAQYSP